MRSTRRVSFSRNTKDSTTPLLSSSRPQKPMNNVLKLIQYKKFKADEYLAKRLAQYEVAKAQFGKRYKELAPYFPEFYIWNPMEEKESTLPPSVRSQHPLKQKQRLQQQMRRLQQHILEYALQNGTLAMGKNIPPKNSNNGKTWYEKQNKVVSELLRTR
jgi:hypothetical protein